MSEHINFIVDRKYLEGHSNCIIVFGENTFRRGTGGAAIFRSCSQSYGFITKKAPSFSTDAYYTPDDYLAIFEEELAKLVEIVKKNTDKKYLITQLGAGLANRFGIWEAIIKDGLEKGLTEYKNVVFLWDKVDERV